MQRCCRINWEIVSGRLGGSLQGKSCKVCTNLRHRPKLWWSRSEQLIIWLLRGGLRHGHRSTASNANDGRGASIQRTWNDHGINKEFVVWSLYFEMLKPSTSNRMFILQCRVAPHGFVNMTGPAAWGLEALQAWLRKNVLLRQVLRRHLGSAVFCSFSVAHGFLRIRVDTVIFSFLPLLGLQWKNSGRGRRLPPQLFEGGFTEIKPITC